MLNKQINRYLNKNSVNIILSRYDLPKERHLLNKQNINHYLGQHKLNIIRNIFYTHYWLLNIYHLDKISNFVIQDHNKINTLNYIYCRFLYQMYFYNNQFHIMKRKLIIIVNCNIVHMTYNYQNFPHYRFNSFYDNGNINY